jgi:hypothetical protein
MLTFSALRLRVRARTAGTVDDATIEAVTRDTLKALWEGWDWSFSQEDAILATVGTKSGGTVTLTTPTTVTGTGTAFLSTDIGRDLFVGNANTHYPVTAVNVGTQTLTLGSAYVGNTFTASSYRLQQSVYALADNFSHSFAPIWWRPLVEVSLPTLNRFDGRRTFSSQLPFSYTYRGANALGAHEIELSAVPATAMGIGYSYRSRLPVLDEDTLIPFREDVPIYLAAADALSIKAVELAEKNPGASQVMQAQAEKYFMVGMAAKVDYQYQDFQVSGAAKAVRDEAGMGGVPDDLYIASDLNFPY